MKVAVKHNGNLTVREMTQDELDEQQQRAYDTLLRELPEEITELRDHHIHKDLEYNGMTLTARQQDMTNMIEAVSMDNAGLLQTPVTWTLADGSTTDLSSDDIKAIAQLMQQRKTDAYANQRSLIAQVQAAETINELKSIDTTQGWPA
jgi:hypothetical protein